MTATKYAYSLKSRQEEFSVAYIRAVAAAAGYSVTKDSIDQDSVDVYISQRGNKDNEDDYPHYSILKVQVKCTYRHKPKSDGFIHFPLKLKNYNDLRRENTGDPFILVVLYIPSSDESAWLVEGRIYDLGEGVETGKKESKRPFTQANRK